jgi:Zn-finger nucleic acid-binding protein
VTTEGAKAGMLCPACRVTLTMADRQGIEIDYCPNCRGVWLDRGELDKIIERSVATMPPAAPAQAASPYGQPPPGADPYRQDYGRRRRDDDDDDDDDDRRGRRRGGFLSDIFDF